MPGPTLEIGEDGRFGFPSKHVLKNVKAKVSGKKLNGGYLFHAVTSKASYSGEITYHITYHRCVEKEARNVIGGLAHFLETELKLDIDVMHKSLVDEDKDLSRDPHPLPHN